MRAAMIGAAMMIAAAPAVADEIRVSGGRDFVLDEGFPPIAAEVEWRGGPRRGLRPVVGLTFTPTSNLLYGGFAFGVPVGPFTVSPSLAVALYDRGRGRDLGNPVVFRTGAELAIPVGRGVLFTMSVHHTSNFYLGDTNPGSESTRVGFVLPIR